MPRIRTVKPDFWKHEDLSELPPETHLLAAALLNYADDEGYFNANPKLVKADCCPLREDSTTVRRSLEKLASIGYIDLGTCEDGKRWGRVRKFCEHQRVDRPRDSKIKGLEIVWDDSTKNRRRIDEGSTPEGNGREGNKEGKENGGPRKRDEIFEAVAEVSNLSLDGLTDTERGRCNRAAKELKKVDATPDEIRRRAKIYRETWPGIDLTPNALAANWSRMQGEEERDPTEGAL